tara:strand:+ start:1072 stop:1236 length:165 start_codon:yes stop_codon:yes gene_type:complete
MSQELVLAQQETINAFHTLQTINAKLVESKEENANTFERLANAKEELARTEGEL